MIFDEDGFVKHHKIVIGVPVFNEGRFILQTLRSIAEQDCSDFVVLISDNASTDETSNICREFSFNDNRFKYYRHTHNMGSLANFEFIYRNTSSPYFMWVGGHDLIDKCYLSTQLKTLESDEKIALAYSHVLWINEVNEFICITNGGDLLHNDSSGINRYLKTIRGPWGECTAINGLFRRSALQGIIFRKIMSPDMIILVRAQFFGIFHRTESPIYMRRDFLIRDINHIERLFASKSDNKFNSLEKDRLILSFYQTLDYFSLPVSCFKKIFHFPNLLMSLHFGYGIFYCLYRAIKRI